MAVHTLIIGPTPGSDDAKNSISLNSDQLSVLAEIKECLPNLKALHLWGIGNLEVIGELPAGIEVLDIRSCPEFRELDEIKGKLEMLFIEDAPEFSSCLISEKLEELRDVSLQGTGITSEFLDELLSKTPVLQRLHLNRCAKLTNINDWHFPKDNLEDIRLSECPNLELLPDYWPALRRLDIRNSPQVKCGFSKSQIPHKNIQFLDLKRAKQIKAFPLHESCFDGANQLQTLYLYGSGISEPPSGLHGSGDDQNVLEDITRYFQDAKIVGRGHIDRSKILMLGNGGVGKTCLSMALHPEAEIPDPAAKAEEMKTTHAIQFFDLERHTNIQDYRKLNLGIWDFGGQEIYHGTHRLFVQTGAVFCILWHPEMNCRPEDSGKPDENRPLQYWLDYIRLARTNGKTPKIAIIVPRSKIRNEEVIQRVRNEVGVENLGLIDKDDTNIFFIESGTRGGEFGRFNEWLEQSVVYTLKSEGANYPSYWVLAESMVTEWQTNPPENIIPVSQFEIELESYINKQLKLQDHKFPKLKDAWNQNVDPFRLQDNNRIERTLRFLTDIGLVFWRPDLKNSYEEPQVIIGQKWALEAIYAILDHRESAAEWRQYMGQSGGIFSLEELNGKGWQSKGYNYSEEDRETIVSLMIQCDICFKIVDKKDSWYERNIYACFAWLPELKMRQQWLDDVDREEGKIESDQSLQDVRMLRHHWYSFLAAAGRQYGRNAEYAKDALKFTLLERNEENGETRRGPTILIHFKHDQKSGIKGSFDIYVTGRKSGHKGVEHAIVFLKSFLPNQPKAKKELEEFQHREIPPVEEERPDSVDVATASVRSLDGPGPSGAVKKPTVFISYSWGGRKASDPENEHTIPVNFIKDSLAGEFRVLMDVTHIEKNGNIWAEIKKLIKSDFAITVTSTGYFTSEYCVGELIQLYGQFEVSPKNILDSVAVIVLFSEQDYFRGENKESLRKNISDHWQEFADNFMNILKNNRGEATDLQFEIFKDDRRAINTFIKHIEGNKKNIIYWNLNHPSNSITEIRNELLRNHLNHPGH